MQPTLKRAWSNLVDYYLKCLEIEQTQTLGVTHQQNHALLRYLTDTMISNGAERAEIRHPSDLREVRQFLARKDQQEGQTLYYAYPLVVQAGVKIPICYAAVEVTANSNAEVILTRQDRPLVNRRFLLERSDLTESEVAEFVRRIGAANDQRKALVLDGEFMWCGLLFLASLDRMTVSLQRELKWLKNQSTLSPPLAAYLQEDPPATRSTNAPGVTVVRSNPAQDKVLRNRFSTLQVVAGPPGTGKTQTIINLIASTVCDQQTVLFISKNNTAVDNVYDAFVEQELFPGILRLGRQEAKKRAVEQVRAVMEQLQEGMPQPEDQAAFDAQGIALNREIARLEEELNEVSTLSATVQEMALLRQRVESDLQERGLYRYATDLAQQITLANAAQFQPPQLVGLRRLVARTALWPEPLKRFWERLWARLGITRWQQRVRFERALQALALPACCTVAGEDLQQRLDNLLRLDTVYPFLLATARHLKATSNLAATRSPELIREELEQVHQRKFEHGRCQLRRRWAEMVNAAQGELAELAGLCSLFERMTEERVEPKEWQKWQDGYSKLLRIFPVICSTNLSLAGAAPNERNLFHLVILDEASQSDIASFLPALYRAQRACVVGDDKQLRHINQWC
jgi:hypothetical protein